MHEARQYSVAVVDDDTGFRTAMAWLLRQHGYAVAEYGDGESFLRNHDFGAVGCALVDLRLSDIDGIALHRLAAQRGCDTPAIMVSGYGDIPTAVEATKSGLFGFVEKPVSDGRLLAMVEAACRLHGERRRKYGSGTDAARRFARLTAREAEVFRLLADGLATKEIAVALAISHRTAEVHRARVFDKLEADSLSGLIRLARLLPAPASGESAAT